MSARFPRDVRRRRESADDAGLRFDEGFGRQIDIRMVDLGVLVERLSARGSAGRVGPRTAPDSASGRSEALYR